MVLRLLVLALALALHVQQATLPSGADLVRLDVRVVDEIGRPITDLQPGEIVIEEDGKALPVEVLQRVDEPAESYVEAAIHAVTAEVSSNKGFPRGRLYVLVFDQPHITPGYEQRARLAAEQFIRRRVRPSDRVAVVGLPGPTPQLGFTADPRRAIQALDGVRGMGGLGDGLSSGRLLQQLADVVSQFRDLEGRKSVVFFSEGFPPGNVARELDAVAAAAAQSHAVFYPFDLNQRPGAPPMQGTVSRISPLATLAFDTGGAMLLDADSRVERADDHYLVGFVPSHTATTSPGSYRRVTVTVRRAGARVNVRTGYAVSPRPTAEETSRAINAVLAAPFVQQALNVDYTTYVMKAREPGQHRIVLSLTAELPIRAAASEVADVVFVARDVRDGRVVASGTDTIALPATPQPGSRMGAGSWHVEFNLPAGSYLMRTVVREPGGLAGSADRRIDTHPLDGPQVTASDLMIGSTMSTPAVRPRALSADGLSGVVEAYGRTVEQLRDLAVTVELRAVDSGVVKTIAATLGPADPEGASPSRRASFQLPLADVPAGNYIAHAIISAPGGPVLVRSRQVEIVGSGGPTVAPVKPAFSPRDVMSGDLAQRHIKWLHDKAAGTPLADAAAHAAAGHWEDVELALAKIRDDASMAAQALKGLALFVREDYKAAATALDRALALGEHALTAFFLGWAQEGAGNSRAALSAWQRAADLDPSIVSAHLALADGYLRQSQPSLAIRALRAGLAAIPGSMELRSRLQQIERLPQAPK